MLKERRKIKRRKKSELTEGEKREQKFSKQQKKRSIEDFFFSLQWLFETGGQRRGGVGGGLR